MKRKAKKSTLKARIASTLLSQLAWRAAIAAIFTVPIYLVVDGSGPAQISDMADSLASVTGVLAGFLLAAISGLHAVTTTRMVTGLCKTGHYQYFLVESLCAVALLATAAVLATIVRVIVDAAAIGWFATLTAFVAAWGLVFLVSVGRKQYTLLSGAL